MSKEVSDGRKRRSNTGAGSTGVASTSTTNDDGGGAGFFPGDGSGEIVERGGETDEGAGGSTDSDSGSTGESRRGSSDSSGSSGDSDGAGADSGRGSGVADTPKRRGRPVGSKNKELPKDASPRLVPLSRLRGGRKKKAHDYTDPFAKGFKVLYEMPKYAGWGDHWPLSDGDALLLGGKLNDVVQELPKGQVRALAEFFDKYINPYLPIASLATALYMVTEPRIAATRQLAEEAKRHGTPTREAQETEPVAPAGSAASNGSVYDGAEHPVGSGVAGEGLADETIRRGAF